MNKRVQTPPISISPPPAVQTIRDEDIPPDFFSLLEELESTLSTQSVVSSTVTQDKSKSHNSNTPTNHHTLTDIPNSTNSRDNLTTHTCVSQTKSTQNISTQTRSARNIRWAPKTEHKQTNTQFIKYVDKSTNTDPLIVLDPIDIRSLHGGLHIATYNPEHQIYMTTNNSLSIMPVPKHTQPTTDTNPKSNTETEGQPTSHFQTSVNQTPNLEINDHPHNPLEPPEPHTSGNNKTTNNNTTQYQPDQLKVKKESNGTAKPLVIFFKLS